ncbi:hypothetical protein [Sinomonas albida]|uniref:hypothetical protein n=1 Tax=Sinomonas albida TaxID=369942 RepID=UPI00301B52C5
MEQVAGPPGCGDVDLSTTVTRLNRIKAKNRARLANSELTRAFLDSGLALTTEVFSEASLALAEGEVSPTLAYLSRSRVLSRAQEDYPELVPTEAKFRDRWAGHQDFVEDFVAYALFARHCSLRRAIAEWSGELLEAETDFATAVHRVAYEGSQLVLKLPAYRLQLLAISSVAADPQVSLAIKRMYESLTADWFELFGHVAETFGFGLRRGVSPREINVILQAVTEGFGIRLLAGLDEPLLDDERRESLLGTAALALFVSLTDNGDGLTIEGAANGQFSRFSLNRKGTS